MSKRVCAACQRNIDAVAKLCPYCGANPQTAEKLDTETIMKEVFRPRTVTASESVLQYARQRQGVVIAVSAFVAFLILAGLHQFATMRNTTAVSDSPAVPLSEITDLTTKADETTPKPIPHLEFQYDGRPQAMRTYIVESGAIAPATTATQPPTADPRPRARQQAAAPSPRPR